MPKPHNQNRRKVSTKKVFRKNILNYLGGEGESAQQLSYNGDYDAVMAKIDAGISTVEGEAGFTTWHFMKNITAALKGINDNKAAGLEDETNKNRIKLICGLIGKKAQTAGVIMGNSAPKEFIDEIISSLPDDANMLMEPGLYARLNRELPKTLATSSVATMKYKNDINALTDDNAEEILFKVATNGTDNDVELLFIKLPNREMHLNATTIDGKTPFMVACQFGNMAFIKKVLSDKDIREDLTPETFDTSRKTGFTYACQREPFSKDLILYLISQGINVTPDGATFLTGKLVALKTNMAAATYASTTTPKKKTQDLALLKEYEELLHNPAFKNFIDDSKIETQATGSIKNQSNSELLSGLDDFIKSRTGVIRESFLKKMDVSNSQSARLGGFKPVSGYKYLSKFCSETKNMGTQFINECKATAFIGLDTELAKIARAIYDYNKKTEQNYGYSELCLAINVPENNIMKGYIDGILTKVETEAETAAVVTAVAAAKKGWFTAGEPSRRRKNRSGKKTRKQQNDKRKRRR